MSCRMTNVLLSDKCVLKRRFSLRRSTRRALFLVMVLCPASPIAARGQGIEPAAQTAVTGGISGTSKNAGAGSPADGVSPVTPAATNGGARRETEQGGSGTPSSPLTIHVGDADLLIGGFM